MADQIYDSNGQLSDLAHTQAGSDKKCPQCDGVMSFDPASGGMLCPYCGHIEKVRLETAYDEKMRPVVSAPELDLASAEKTANCDWGVAKKIVICKSCGGEAVYDALQIAGACPYCGSKQVMESHDKETLAPGGVCPFRVPKEAAVEAFRKWIGSKWFAPSEAKRSCTPDTINGLYLPYWTFDTDTVSAYSARYGIDHMYTDHKGNTHTSTDWYKTSGTYHEFFDDALVIGTSRHNIKVLQAVEPFKTAENVIYKPEFVSGFVTERYALGVADAWTRAKEGILRKIHGNITTKIKREKHADHVDRLRVNPQFNSITYKYLLLPVWVSAFTYEGKVYEFMVNGQTGKVGGNYPKSIGKIILVIVLCIIAAMICLGCFGLANLI